MSSAGEADVRRVLVLVLGVSGAGKNVALGALEDAGFAVINNLPADLLCPAVERMFAEHTRHVAISVNAQQHGFVKAYTQAIGTLSQLGDVALHVISLDADDPTLVKRFAETRRRHPFVRDGNTLVEAIAEERARIRDAAPEAIVFDTTATSAHVLRLRIRELARTLAEGHEAGRMLIVVSSFAYRNGIPGDADLVFDARILPNPYYVSGLATLTGRDQPVREFLEQQPETSRLLDAIKTYLDSTLDAFTRDNRVRVHIAIGCTGGQHRSVFVADAVAAHLRAHWRVTRHDREHPRND